MYENIAEQRFFRSKQAGITKVSELRSADLGPARWALVDVDGDIYQLILAGEQDVLDSPDVLAEISRCFASEEAVGEGTLEVVSRPVIPVNAEVSVSAAEQSNSSLIFRGEGPAIAKFFRKLEPGINPDVELLAGLAQVDCAFVPTLRAYSTTSWQGETYVTAMVQDFAAGSKEGWDLATSFAAEQRDFTAEAALIGEALREVHCDLRKAFGTQEVSARGLVTSLFARLETLLKQAPVLADYEDRINVAYEAAAEGTVTVQRIHGDAHLGQILRSSDRYLFIDFEGEPARPLSERRQMFSPLQDVAGLIRSFDYAAHFGGTLQNPTAWSTACAEAMLNAYGAEGGALLDALILDKALYEVAYEANNRPDWLHIPLGAVQRLLDK